MNYHPPKGQASDSLIAIVGVACRFPGAPDPRALWRLLVAGDHALREVPRDRWPGQRYVSADRRQPGKMVTARGGFLDQVDGFDAAFFAISSREAVQIDPQQRLALELSWEALEHAGVAPDRLRGSDAAVFMGAMWTDYARLHDITDIEQHSGTGWHLGVVPGRVSYALGLRGPSLAVNTACSSSLVAVDLACRALREGETSLALAGGVSLMLTPHVGVAMSKFGGTSASGRCFAYDARADGYVRGEGGGVVALRRYPDALARGERILAVIRASAVNNDGGGEGLTAPSEAAQRSLLRHVYARAGVDPRAVVYVEGHGTGTPVGDPIEARALGAELGGARERPLWLGSIKPNIGHTEAASGVASLIKTALALDAGLIPPNRNFAQPNPAIDFDGLGLRVPTAAQVWQGPRLAGVNSFGFGGTNCHIVLEGPPALAGSARAAARPPGGAARPLRLVAVSAGDRAALGERVAQLRARVHAATGPDAPTGQALELDDLAHTTWHRRAHLEHRAVVSAASLTDLHARLERGELVHGGASSSSAAPPVVFAFSGQGSQSVEMGRELAAVVPAFRAALAACSAEMQPHTGWSMIDAVEGGALGPRLEAVDGIQPAIFAIQVALAATWSSLGVTPAAVVGHSMGEVAAAVAAGAITLADGARITCERARLLRRISGHGGMLSLNLAADLVERLLGADPRRYAGLGVAVDVGLDATIVSGGLESLARLRDDVLAGAQPWAAADRELELREVAVDVAAHSPQIDAIADEFLAAIAGVRSQPTAVRMVSSVTGGDIDHRDLTAAYWVRNLRQRVRFGEAAGRLLDDGLTTIVELSPHPLLTWPLRQMVRARALDHACVLGSLRRARPEHGQLLDAIAALHLRGVAVTLDQPGALVELPPYPWQRRRFWPQQDRSSGHGRAARASHPAELALSFDRARLPALTEHRVDGLASVSAGVALELFARAWAAVEPGAGLRVEALEFIAPLAGERGVTLELHAGLISLAAGQGQDPSSCVRARLVASAGALELTRPPPAQLVRELDATSHYARLAASGVDYGPALRGVEAIALGPSVARVSLAPGSSRAAVLDAAFQAARAAVDDPAALVVSGVREINLALERLASVTTIHASSDAPTSSSAPGHLVQVWLLDADGRAVAHLAGLRLSPRCAASGPLRRRSWRALEPQPGSQGAAQPVTRVAALLPADSGARARCQSLIQALSARVVAPGFAQPGTDLLVVPCPAFDASGLDVPTTVSEACARLIRAVRDVVRGSEDPARWPQIVAVTERAHAVQDPDPNTQHPASVCPGPSALAALVRVAAAEHPQLRIRAIDLGQFDDPREHAGLARALASGSSHPMLAVRGDAALVPTLTPLVSPAKPWAPRSGVVVVTGALGGIGRAVVEHLAGCGVERLLLLGRRALAEGDAGFVRALATRTGASLRYVSVDIGDRERLAAALAPERDALIGVVHAAAALSDAPLVDHGAAELDAALRAKFVGAWHLHQLTAGLTLDLFALFGSLGAWVGLPGQAGYAAANAALDGLAEHRRARGLAATSIGWCGWESLGFARSAGGSASLQRLANEGIGALAPADALALCERLFDPGAAIPASLAVMPRPAAGPATDLGLATVPRLTRRALAVLPGPGRRQAVLEVVLDEVAAVLREESARVDPQRALRDLGLDSLMAVELAERLTRALDITASTTLIWRYPTIDALVDHALSALDPAATAAPPTEASLPETDALVAELVDELGDLSDEEVEALTRVL